MKTNFFFSIIGGALAACWVVRTGGPKWFFFFFLALSVLSILGIIAAVWIEKKYPELPINERYRELRINRKGKLQKK